MHDAVDLPLRIGMIAFDSRVRRWIKEHRILQRNRSTFRWSMQHTVSCSERRREQYAVQCASSARSVALLRARKKRRLTSVAKSKGIMCAHHSSSLSTTLTSMASHEKDLATAGCDWLPVFNVSR
jgi:hypothetical protein